MLILERPWTRQPQGTVELDRRFAESAVGVWVPGLGEITGKRAAGNVNADSVSPIGRVYQQNGGHLERRVLDSAVDWVPTSGGFSLLVLYQYGTALGNGGLGVGASGTLSHRATLDMSTSGTLYFDYGGATEGATRVSGSVTSAANAVACMVATTGPGGMRLFVNGRLIGSNSANPSRINGGIYGFVVGDCYGGFAGSGARQGVVVALAAQLPDALAQALSVNPWQLFAPQQIYIPTAAAAASSLPTLSASTYVPGSVTATGWRPRVTAEYA